MASLLSSLDDRSVEEAAIDVLPRLRGAFSLVFMDEGTLYAAKFNDDGSVASPAYVTVLHNGVLLHNHFELMGGTSYVEPPKYSKHGEKEPLNIQFHGNPVRFRNIWIREIREPEGMPGPVGVEPKKK